MPSDIDIMISFRCFRRTAQVVVCVSRFHVKIDKVETPMEDSKQARLEAASNPRRATLDDAVQLSYLFATAFMDDPIFDYMVRPGAGRRAALGLFFRELFSARDIPQNEVWMSPDGAACVSWLAPDARHSPGGIFQKLSWVPFFFKVSGIARVGRILALLEAMAKNHPQERHFYLAYAAVSPEFQGNGLGSRLVKATLERIDEASMPVYVESSNPKNINFYERLGFVARQNIAPDGAPPLVSMWRDARRQ
jgi:ribosomal protein S18 acetylase RimI-like enzyme